MREEAVVLTIDSLIVGRDWVEAESTECLLSQITLFSETLIARLA
jgi:hypothetical protein